MRSLRLKSFSSYNSGLKYTFGGLPTQTEVNIQRRALNTIRENENRMTRENYNKVQKV